MTPRYSIRTARPQDLTRLPAIELAAARLLAGRAPESVLNDTTSADVLQNALQEGQLWVALADGAAVGFARVEVVERDAAHLEEIDVDPGHGRRGLGTRLVLRVCDWAAGCGYESVTLTTFRDVPWNMPFYAGLGFEIVPSARLTPALRLIVEDETRRGLDPASRVVMRRWLHPDASVSHDRQDPAQANEASDMSDVTLLPVDPAAADVQFLEDRIYEFNSGVTGIGGGEMLAFFVREGAQIVAGICGNTWGGTCELRQFWVEASRRDRGLGTALFEAAEREARRRGCTQIVLMTFSFQAPAFYERHGFEVITAIDHHPRGHRNLLMRKALTLG